MRLDPFAAEGSRRLSSLQAGGHESRRPSKSGGLPAGSPSSSSSPPRISAHFVHRLYRSESDGPSNVKVRAASSVTAGKLPVPGTKKAPAFQLWGPRQE